MNIMNTKSASRIICKLLALGLALSPIGSSAKVGEQENWYLAKEVQLPSDFTPQKYWSDSIEEALLGWSGNKLHKLNFSSKDLTFSSNATVMPVDGVNDPEPGEVGLFSGFNISDIATSSQGDLLIVGAGLSWKVRLGMKWCFGHKPHRGCTLLQEATWSHVGF